MKFEKFFKSAGTHGLIVKENEVDSWLLCGGVCGSPSALITSA